MVKHGPKPFPIKKRNTITKKLSLKLKMQNKNCVLKYFDFSMRFCTWKAIILKIIKKTGKS